MAGWGCWGEEPPAAVHRGSALLCSLSPWLPPAQKSSSKSHLWQSGIALVEAATSFGPTGVLRFGAWPPLVGPFVES